MIAFKKLSIRDNEALLKYPVYLSMLAADSEDKLDEDEKKAALKLAHIKTFTSDKLLVEFYKLAVADFEKNIDQLNKDLPKETDSREAAIHRELVILDKISLKLGKNHAAILRQSLKAFKAHVSNAHSNLLVNFIIPVAIPGLTE